MPQLQPELTFRALSLLLIVFLGVMLVGFFLVFSVERESVWLAA
jgi:hypothetical protein